MPNIWDRAVYHTYDHSPRKMFPTAKGLRLLFTNIPGTGVRVYTSIRSDATLLLSILYYRCKYYIIFNRQYQTAHPSGKILPGTVYQLLLFLLQVWYINNNAPGGYILFVMCSVSLCVVCYWLRIVSYNSACSSHKTVLSTYAYVHTYQV